MEVCSAVSGERLACLDADDFLQKSAKAVKQALAVKLGVPRFRQRVWVTDDTCAEIPDEEFFDSSHVKVSLVLLEFEPMDVQEVHRMILACQEK